MKKVFKVQPKINNQTRTQNVRLIKKATLQYQQQQDRKTRTQQHIPEDHNNTGWVDRQIKLVTKDMLKAEKIFTTLRTRLAELKEIKRLKQLPIDEYIQTEHWQRVSKQALQLRNNCSACLSTFNLQVFIINPGRKGYENVLNDLKVLCQSCYSTELIAQQKLIEDRLVVDKQRDFYEEVYRNTISKCHIKHQDKNKIEAYINGHWIPALQINKPTNPSATITVIVNFKGTHFKQFVIKPEFIRPLPLLSETINKSIIKK